MAIKLRLRFLISSVLTFLLALWLTNPLLAQVEVKNSSLFELSFKEGRTVSMSDVVRIGLDDHELISDIGISADRISEFDPESPAKSDLFYIDDQGGTALGYPYTFRDDRQLINLSLKNSTGAYIDQVTLAFDFLYLLPEENDGDVSFQLSFRVENGKWVTPEGARFSSSMLDVYREGWNSFSLQISVNELFIRPDDQVEIRWIAESDDNFYIPVALQRLELIPVTTSTPAIKQGSVVISEILPFSENQSENYAAEYIELYNLENREINLKGFTVRAGDFEHVIQRDLKVAPYETVVLGYTQNLDFLDRAINYHYNQPLLTDQSGSIHFTAGGSEPIRATYQVSEKGRALQLDHISSGYDGYSSLQNFMPSEVEITSSIYGSPGQVHSHRKLYSAQIDKAGWHFLYAPGVISRELNRITGAELYRISEENELAGTNFMDLPDREPFWIYHHGESVMRLFSNHDSDAEQGKLFIKPLNGFIAGGNVSHTPILLNKIVNESGQQAFPAILVWNSEDQQFRMVIGGDDEQQVIEPWSGFVAPVAEGELSYDETASRGISRDYFRRYLSFTLMRQESGGRFTKADQPSVLAFFDTPEDTLTARFDLPLIEIPSLSDDSHVTPLLYLESHFAAFEANRFLHLPATPEEPNLIGIGTRLGSNSGTFRITWDEPDNFPDDWIIELRDEYSGERINMRENRYYEFRSRGGRNNQDYNAETIEFAPYSPDQPADRFFLYISPYPELYDTQEQANEKPESIKLHQNYPNPFNPATTISFHLPERSQVRLGIYNVVGQQVGLLKDEQMAEGDHAVVWNAIDMPSGIYIVQLETPGNVLTRKITLIK